MRLDRGNWGLLGLAALLAVLLVAERLAREPAAEVVRVTWPAVDAELVDEFRLRNRHGAVVAHLRDDRWVMDDPPGEILDPAMLAGVLETFSVPTSPDIRLAERVDDPATYGLGDDERIEVEFRAGGESLLALEIGEAVGRTESFVRPAGERAVYRAPIGSRFRLERPPAEWRDHTITDLDEGRTIGLDLEHSGESWSYRRNAQDWICLQDPELLLDTPLVEQIARTLTHFRAHDIVDDPPADAFAEIPLRVTAHPEVGAPVTLEFGALDEEEGLYYLRRGDRSFRVAESRYETLAVRPAELRDRRVARLDWREIRQVRLEAGSWAFVARPLGDKAWELIEPADYAVDDQALGYSVDALITLRAFELVDDVPRAESGVDGPAAVVFTVERLESSPVVIRIAPERDGRHLLIREGRSQLYAIPPHMFRSLVQGFGIVP